MFGLFLMLVVLLRVGGVLPSGVTCFHQEVEVRVVVLGIERDFRRAEESYGECPDEDTEHSVNIFVVLSEPLKL